MGRKKKVQEEPTQPKEIKVETPVNSVSYTGVISVSLQKGKKTYFTKQYRNKGRWPLFYFLNCCLRGDYGVADLYRPKYINAFGDASWEDKDEPNITDEEGSIVSIDQYFTEAYRKTVSSYPYLSLPDIETEIEDKNIGSSMITYKFNIPFSQISNIHHINAFALYAEPVRTGTSGTARNAIDNPCAFFFILDEETHKVIDLMKGLDDQDLGDEYNLYIQWTLSISNSQYNKTTPVPPNQMEPTPEPTEPEEPSEPSEEQGE